MPIALPQRNTFIHFPEMSGELSLDRSTTCPAYFQPGMALAAWTPPAASSAHADAAARMAMAGGESPLNMAALDMPVHPYDNVENGGDQLLRTATYKGSANSPLLTAGPTCSAPWMKLNASRWGDLTPSTPSAGARFPLPTCCAGEVTPSSSGTSSMAAKSSVGDETADSFVQPEANAAVLQDAAVNMDNLAAGSMRWADLLSDDESPSKKSEVQLDACADLQCSEVRREGSKATTPSRQVRWADLSEDDVSPLLHTVVVETPPHESDRSEADEILTSKITTVDEDRAKVRTRKSEQNELKVAKASKEFTDVDSHEWTRAAQKKATKEKNGNGKALRESADVDSDGWTQVAQKKVKKEKNDTPKEECVTDQDLWFQAGRKKGKKADEQRGVQHKKEIVGKSMGKEEQPPAKPKASRPSHPPSRGSMQKFLCRYNVGIEQDRTFNVVRKLLGDHGSHMKEIVENSGAKLRIRGRGSGFLEGAEKREASDEPLMICISATSQEGFATATEDVESLLDYVHGQYRAFCDERGLPIPELAISRGEQPAHARM